MKERHERGLCFNCGEKFRPGHCCKKLFLIEGIYPEEGEDTENDWEREDQEPIADGRDTPKISINALTGVSTPQPMRVRGRCKGGGVVMLVDMGSTHNFLSTGIA
jgi:hypothetical protein